jgi:4-amino-4-deoxy-L-arabinose transferase-like glycosyltransferase
MSSHHGEEHAIHVPAPSFSPPILGLAVMLIAFGVLLGLPLLILGAIIFVIGIATWLIDDARAYQQAGDPTDGAHH